MISPTTSSDLPDDMPRRCDASLLLNIIPNIPRICINRKIMTTATNVQTISLCKLQHLLLELLLLVPPVELFPICISALDPPPLGGLRKLPAPLGVIPADRFVFRMCSPCSNLGGRRACRELMFA
jgi:hypothetical protein